MYSQGYPPSLNGNYSTEFGNIDGSEKESERGNALPGNMSATASSADPTYPLPIYPTASGRGAVAPPQNQHATGGLGPSPVPEVEMYAPML